MNLILVKMFATALALAQVTTRPNAVKTQFDPITDQAEVVQLLKNGCAHMRKAFDIEDLNLDDLIETALQDPQTSPARSRRSAESISTICTSRTGSSAARRRSRIRRSTSPR